MSRTSKAAIVTLAFALLVELSLERATISSDVIAAILGASIREPAAILALYVARLTLVATVALLGYRLSSWACRRVARAS
ncbi:MAG: hypothetical protein RIF41_19875 [Polyangiaceae bacterium]